MKIIAKYLLLLMFIGIFWDTEFLNAEENYNIITDKSGKNNILADKVYIRLQTGYYGEAACSTILADWDISNTEILLKPEYSLRFNQTQRIPQISNNIDIFELLKAEEPLLRTFVIDVPNDMHPEDFCKELIKKNLLIEIAEPYYVYETMDSFEPNDPLRINQTFLQRIQAYQAWGVEMGNSNVVVCISDNGVNQEHEDLKNSIAPNLNETIDDTDTDGNGYIDDYMGYNFAAADGFGEYWNTFNSGTDHGTQIAGIIGATTNNGIGVAGVGNRCRIFPLRTARTGRTIYYGYQSVTYAAVRGFDVLNLSWGSNKIASDVEQSVINYAVANDVAIVASSGNQGGSTNADLFSSFYPAGYYGVLAVGEVDQNDLILLNNTVLSFTADIMAPGKGNYTTLNDGGYGILQEGSSYSAPVVSGTVALVRSKFPELSAIQALEHVRLNTDDISDINNIYTELIPGRVNMYKAVSSDPFAKPAIKPQRFEYRNTDNIKVYRYSVGQELLLYIDVKNYLGAAQNLIFELSDAYNPNNSVSVLESTYELSNISSLENTTIGPFKIKINSKRTESMIFRIDISGENNFKDFFKFEFIPTIDYMTFENTSIIFSMGDKGEFGFSSTSGSDLGYGFALKGYGNQLYARSGILASESSGKLVSFYFDDFDVVKPFDNPDEHINIINDNLAPQTNKIGVELQQEVYLPDMNNGVTRIKVQIKNISGDILNDVSVGYHLDWDIAGDEDFNKIELFDEAIPAELNGNSATATIASYISDYPVFGIAVHSNEENSEAQAAGMTYTSSFSRTLQWELLNSGKTFQTDEINDISTLVGMKYWGVLDEFETRNCIFCIAGAENRNTLANLLSQCLLNTVSVEDENTMEKFSLFPNPTKNSVYIFTHFVQEGKIKILLTDLTGTILQSMDLMHLGGELKIPLNIDNLTSGMYFVRIFHQDVYENLKFLIKK